MHTLGELVGMPNEMLAKVDPLEMNLLVAKVLPHFRDLDIARYAKIVDDWAADFRMQLGECEYKFHLTPGDWDNDIHKFRLGVLCWYISEVLGIRYKEGQRDLEGILYTDATDLFLNGVIDSRQGTCGNMAALFVCMCWRIGWPVRLVMANAHFFCRFENGEVRHNIEATNFDRGFRTPYDSHYKEEHRIPDIAIEVGSDLKTLTHREMLAEFFGLRGRHHRDCNRVRQAEEDFLFARALFPDNRRLYMAQIECSVTMSEARFVMGEKGSINGLLHWLRGSPNPMLMKRPSQQMAEHNARMGLHPPVASTIYFQGNS
jgi:hypothetical protein